MTNVCAGGVCALWVQGLRYASFDEQQGGVGLASRPVSEPRGGLVEVDVDYSKQRLSTDSEYREQVRHRGQVWCWGRSAQHGALCA